MCFFPSIPIPISFLSRLSHFRRPRPAATRISYPPSAGSSSSVNQRSSDQIKDLFVSFVVSNVDKPFLSQEKIDESVNRRYSFLPSTMTPLIAS
ncbi:unnamed protein product [Lactuca virosa]|uniref:Uncharacterized protein n=1 Tax=Lactuca virosa TaxID=75947 RepID=A0AAU9PAX5_9ASTR|nr:unnamed protein product [Lactuca virosa]